MFEKYKERRKKTKIKDLKEWYKYGIELCSLKKIDYDRLWKYIINSIEYISAEFSYGGLRNSYILINLSNGKEFFIREFWPHKALKKALTKIYIYKINKLK